MKQRIIDYIKPYIKKGIHYSKYIVCNRVIIAFAIYLILMIYIVEFKGSIPLGIICFGSVLLLFYIAWLVCTLPKFTANKYEQPMVDFFKRLGEDDDTYENQ